MKAITVKYVGPTNFRGSRLIASDGDHNKITISYPHKLSGSACYAKAAVALCKKMGWTGTLISGGTKDAEVFVFSHSDHFKIK